MPSGERLFSKFHSCFTSRPTVHFDNLSAFGKIFQPLAKSVFPVGLPQMAYERISSLKLGIGSYTFKLKTCNPSQNQGETQLKNRDD